MARQPRFSLPGQLQHIIQKGNIASLYIIQKWLLDAYDANHAYVNTVGLCFKYAGAEGSHQRYTRYSDTFKGWQGAANQEGVKSLYVALMLMVKAGMQCNCASSLILPEVVR